MDFWVYGGSQDYSEGDLSSQVVIYQYFGFGMCFKGFFFIVYFYRSFIMVY